MKSRLSLPYQLVVVLFLIDVVVDHGNHHVPQHPSPPRRSSELNIPIEEEEQEQKKIRPLCWRSVSLRDVKDDALQDFGHMLSSNDTADAQLVCRDTKFPCHRSVLAARSSVFKAMFYGPGKFKESKKNCRVVIEEFQPEEVKQFLRFVYSGVCDFKEVDPWHILTLADKYDVEMLNKFSCQVII